MIGGSDRTWLLYPTQMFCAWRGSRTDVVRDDSYKISGSFYISNSGKTLKYIKPWLFRKLKKKKKKKKKKDWGHFVEFAQYFIIKIIFYRCLPHCFKAAVDSEGLIIRRGSVETPFDSKFHFHSFWINLGYHIYPKYSHPLLLFFSSTSQFYYSSQKHGYSNMTDFLQQQQQQKKKKKKENFQIKILIFFHIFAQNIHCGYSLEPPQWGGSNEYHKAMLFSKIPL